jgi:sec-independent protein translocase protein TatA
MFGLSPVELMVVGVVAILLFGSKLPEVARSLGGSYREFRKGLSEFQDQMKVVDLNKPLPPKKSVKADFDDEDSFVEPTAPKFVPPSSRTAEE